MGIIAVFLVCFFVYYNQISPIKKHGYSDLASRNILFSGNKSFVLSVNSSDTLNRAFEEGNYKEKYLSNYAKIKYQDQKHLIENINKLLDKGYSNSDVSLILAHGSDSDVTEFTKRERIKYLEEFYQFPYAKLKNYDRYVNYSDTTGENEKTSVIHVNLDMDKTEYEDSILVSKFSIDMLVNKYHHLDSEFEPDDLVLISPEYTDGDGDYYANKEAYNALIQMLKSAEVDGMQMQVNSAYRSYQNQLDIIEYYRKWYGDNYVNNYVSKAGYSEHQTGLSFDIGSKRKNIFAESEEYNWIMENCYKFGFIRRFTKKTEGITGFRSEPWHYRYVGKEIAKYIYENNITFEEYYVMFLDK